MYLCEGLFVLALDDEKGEILESLQPVFEKLLPGTVLAELALCGRILLVDGRVQVSDPTPMDHPVLDKALAAILEAPKFRKPRYWINTLAHAGYADEVARQLVEQGMLIQIGRCLHLAPMGENGSAKYTLKTRLRAVIFTNQPPAHAERILLDFIYHADLLKLLHTHGERKAVTQRVKQLAENSEDDPGFCRVLDELISACCEA